MSQRDDDPYAAAWRRYRRWSRAFWAVFVRYLPVLDVASRALGWRRGRLSLVSGVLGLVLIGWGVPAESQVHISAEERFFRIEWQLERAGGRDVAIVGSVANHYLYRLEWVELQAQVRDDAGQTTHETRAVVNDVPAGGRGAFRLELPAAGGRYSVMVHAFEFGRRESP